MVVPEVSVSLALYDYLPNIIWIFGSYFLVSAVKEEIKKIFLNILILGISMIFIGGMLKATWKLAIAATGSNISILNDVQFILMGPGFFLMFISILSVVLGKRGSIAGRAAGIASLNKAFLPLMVLGSLGANICLIILAKRRKATVALILYIASIVMSTSMGYVGAKIVAQSYWVVFLEQTANSSSVLVSALGSYFLWKAGKKLKLIIR